MELRQSLIQAKQLILAGEKLQARAFLGEIIQHFPDCEEAWILTAYTTNERKLVEYCVNRALQINPSSIQARKIQAALQPRPEQATSKPVSSFGETRETVQGQTSDRFLSHTQTQVTSSVQETSSSPTIKFVQEDITHLYSNGIYPQITTPAKNSYSGMNPVMASMNRPSYQNDPKLADNPVPVSIQRPMEHSQDAYSQPKSTQPSPTSRPDHSSFHSTGSANSNNQIPPVKTKKYKTKWWLLLILLASYIIRSIPYYVADYQNHHIQDGYYHAVSLGSSTVFFRQVFLLLLALWLCKGIAGGIILAIKRIKGSGWGWLLLLIPIVIIPVYLAFMAVLGEFAFAWGKNALPSKKKCPRCQSWIPYEASLCQFCHQDLTGDYPQI